MTPQERWLLLFSKFFRLVEASTEVHLFAQTIHTSGPFIAFLLENRQPLLHYTYTALLFFTQNKLIISYNKTTLKKVVFFLLKKVYSHVSQVSKHFPFKAFYNNWTPLAISCLWHG